MRADVLRTPLGLLGRHVRRGAHDLAGGVEERSPGRTADALGDAEIHDVEVIVVLLLGGDDHGAPSPLDAGLLLRQLALFLSGNDHQVGRLDVPVDDAQAVGVVDGAGRVPDDGDQAAHVVDLGVVQGLARDVLHGDVNLAAGLAHLEHRCDVRVIEPRGGAGLPPEHGDRFLVLLLSDELQRGIARQLPVPRQHDPSHPSDAQLPHEDVLPSAEPRFGSEHVLRIFLRLDDIGGKILPMFRRTLGRLHRRPASRHRGDQDPGGAFDARDFLGILQHRHDVVGLTRRAGDRLLPAGAIFGHQFQILNFKS